MTREQFVDEVLKLGVEVTDFHLDLLDKYYKLLIEWNEKINLTSITNYEEVYLKHFYDSLTVCKVIDLNNEESFCDVGTGAGFPGIVIKIFFPHLKMTLVDALNKRVNFLKIVISDLNLKDIEVVHARAEEFALDNREIFDVVCSRAVAAMNVLLEFCLPMVKISKYFIALKGKNLDEYSFALSKLNGKVIDENHFYLPIEKSERTIIKVQKTAKTSLKYPRRFSEIKKRPL